MSDRKPSIEHQIINLAAQGHGRRFICSHLHVGEHRVGRVLAAFDSTGFAPPPLPRGRPHKVTKAILDFIDIRTLQTAHVSSAALATEISDRFHVSLGKTTVDVKRKLMGFGYQPPRHTQELKPEHKEYRVEFCDQMCNNPDWLPLIHFSDESRFVLGDDKRWVWYRRGEENESATHTTRKFPPAVMIFGVIGIGYKSKLLFVDGTIDTDRYIDNLAELGFIEELDQLHGTLEWIFQQDGAPCHTSQRAIDWIEENCQILGGWRANSPDLNPIEMLWAILKHSVAALEPKTIDELKQVLLQAWNTIPQRTIDGLCQSFEDRVHLCRDMGGESISKMLWQCGENSAYKQWREDLHAPQPWTAEEDQLLYEQFRRVGPKWKSIAKMFSGRTDAAVKHRWYTVVCPREHALLGQTELMMDIRERARNQEPIPELCFGDLNDVEDAPDGEEIDFEELLHDIALD
jgi:transposase